MVKLGVTFPQAEIGNDPLAIRDFAQAVEALGYNFLLIYDHVLGVNPERPGGVPIPWTYRDAFHEPMVVFGYLSACTSRIELVTGVLVLPIRQAALVAKQATEVDLLSGGRLRLGVGIGWNSFEFEAMGANFHNRGRRIEEQIALMRALWAEPLASFSGQWHQLNHVGLNPLPIRKSIPILMGGRGGTGEGEIAALRRVARLADGWVTPFDNPEGKRERIERLHLFLRAEGRAVESFSILATVEAKDGTPGDWVKQCVEWESIGVTEVTFDTMGAGFLSLDHRVRALQQLAAELRKE